MCLGFYLAMHFLFSLLMFMSSPIQLTCPSFKLEMLIQVWKDEKHNSDLSVLDCLMQPLLLKFSSTLLGRSVKRIKKKNKTKQNSENLPTRRDHPNVKSGQTGMLEKVIVWEKAFSSFPHKWRQALLKRQWVLVPSMAWKACLEPSCGKQRVKIVVCNISNNEVIYTVHPSSVLVSLRNA